MLRNSRPAYRHMFGNLTDGVWPRGNALEDGQASGIAERLERLL